MVGVRLMVGGASSRRRLNCSKRGQAAWAAGVGGHATVSLLTLVGRQARPNRPCLFVVHLPRKGALTLALRIRDSSSTKPSPCICWCSLTYHAKSSLRFTRVVAVPTYTSPHLYLQPKSAASAHTRCRIGKSPEIHLQPPHACPVSSSLPS